MASSSPLAPLPHTLVHTIFEYALIHPDHRGLGASRSAVPDELKTLAAVSQEWNEYARNVASDLTLRTLLLEDLKIRTRQDLLELRRRIVLRRGHLRELCLRDSNRFNKNQDMHLSVMQWHELATHMPLLETVDLKWIAREDVVRIAVIVRAVRQQCPSLRTLELPSLRPTRSGRVSEKPQNMQLLVDAVLDGEYASHGLQSLRFPLAFTATSDPHAKAMSYLTKICDVCPNLETLNGYEALVDNNEQLVADEQWHIDVRTWERFCRTLHHLKSFDWVVVPFATTFFEIFGHYPKPKLEKLVLSTPMNWDWDQYFRRLGTPRFTNGYGASARNAHAVLKASPALRDLEIAVYLPGDGGDDDEEEEGFGWDVYGAIPDRRVRVPDRPMLDQEIFGDEFCEHVAKYCTQLEKFTIWRVLETSNVSQTIMGFGDRAMRALATLPLLRWVELKSVNITGDGLFALAACFSPESCSAKLQREFTITVGDEHGTPTAMAFYEIVERFLELLVKCGAEDLPCANRQVALRLHNGRFKSLDKTWSTAYLARISHLVEIAKATHPTIRLRLLTRRFDRVQKSCDNIIEFGFYTKTATINEWWGWKDEPQDTQIDDVVFCRGSLYAGERPSTIASEEDDDDDEFGDY